jgi:hypothetical protein
MKPVLPIVFAFLCACVPAPMASAAAQQPAKLVQDYEPRPAIWLLSDHDTKIYLFGTTHMLPPGFKWRSRALDRVVKEAGELVVETYFPPEEEEEQSMALLAKLMLDKPVPILTRVPEKQRPALQAAIGRSEVSVEVLSQLRTWAAAVVLGLAEQLSGWGVEKPDEAPGVEDGLEQEFREAGKPILSVETPDAGLEAFNSLSEEEQVALLVEGLEEAGPAAEAKSDEHDRLWATGRFEEAAVEALKEFPPLLFDGLVTRRNAAWTDWLVARLERPGTVLFAVGAAHLAGDVAVQQMLGKRGLKVERVD